MHIITWNIKHGGTHSLSTKIINNLIAHDPDIIVLTEYKQNKGAHLRNSLKTTGWRYQVTSSLNESENSVLIASKKVLKISPQNRFLPKATHRWLEVQIQKSNLTILGIHIPGANDKWDKEDFWKCVVRFAKQNAKSDALIIGDFNTGLPIDTEGTAFAFPEYMHKLINLGWTDAWRLKHPQKREFTWYSPKAMNGFRLDYAFLSPSLKEGLVRAFHSHTERKKGLSDHSSLVIELDLSKKSKFNNKHKVGF